MRSGSNGPLRAPKNEIPIDLIEHIVGVESSRTDRKSLYHTQVMGVYENIQSFLAQEDQVHCTTIRLKTLAKTREALAVIREAYEKYNDEEIALSYNGGKDCLVLLVLLVAVLEARAQNSKTKSRRIGTVYVAIKDPFTEVDDFVTSSALQYGLDVVKIQKPMKSAFADYLEHYPSVRAILVGTRRNDPHGSQLSFFDETDQGWPKFMRVHPIINWEYAEVWEFLKALDVPYCVLYDRGYTSLGGFGDTLPNPSLQIAGPESSDSTNPDAESLRYRPAWQLLDGGEERLGRDRARDTAHDDVAKMNHRTSLESEHPKH